MGILPLADTIDLVRIGPGRVGPMASDALVAHLLAHSVREGEFTLKSGRSSRWFIDSKQTACRPDGIIAVTDAALEVIPPEATAIGGLTVGADPVLSSPPHAAANRTSASSGTRTKTAAWRPIGPPR